MYAIVLSLEMIFSSLTRSDYPVLFIWFCPIATNDYLSQKAFRIYVFLVEHISNNWKPSTFIPIIK